MDEKDDYAPLCKREIALFMRDYERICRQYGLMVFSDGESVEIGEVDETLWGLLK